MTKIGYGNRKFDQFVLIFYATVTLTLFAVSLFQYNAIWLALVMTIGTTVVAIQKLNCAYVKIEKGYFVIERLFRKPEMIEVGMYKNIAADSLSVPFSNVMTIRFGNGAMARIMGGVKTLEEVNDIIFAAMTRQ